ncbi:putative capsid protein [Avon-Heathcote Estuary associated circular virus 1]|uniref:putative capsid protein n=1 Tax=Avon-Heathcote Estuary associated circular virus 1 TaxID=1618232 RepID=UPI0005CD3A24|nr:putative capsid protein [Avon-Heathcote Estuary associated circular virus 1]AJP36332.1 putative capsid protein [Avon-Heathcote Estuary associated circular virus 1]AJP36334.1 putative capsid protein [Avon-Heathcote Estuary associated circular virus 1]
MPLGRLHPYRRGTAARKIQAAFRRRRTKKRFQRDKIKTAGDVRRAVQQTSVSSVVVQETQAQGLSTTPTVIHNLSKIEFNNSNDTLYARKSKQITVGHFKFRAKVNVADKTNLIRIMVVRNKDPATTNAFDPADMFAMNNSQGLPADNMFAEPNLRNVEVKYDRVFNLQATSETIPAVNPQSVYWTFDVPVRETFKYFGTTNGTSEQTRNMKDYYLLGFSDSSLITHPTIQVVSYVWFKNVGNTA